jgi:nicotinate-nucleotide adenylyltransferase
MQTKLLNKKVGLYFGSFNPVHVGHLIVAKAALENTDLDELWFVVSPENPAKRKSGELEDANHRLAMVQKAIDDESKFSACDVEFSMPRPSFTADTLRVLRDKNPETKFSIVAGTDTQRKMGNYWKNREEILDMHDIIVYPREVSEKDSKWVLTDKAHAVSTYLTDVPQIDISATLIRKNIQSNKSIRYFVPDAVIEHINQNNLFQK